MWDFFETVRHRHSVRSYQPDMPVEEEKLHAILEMACAAPSAGDLQSYHIIVVRNQDQRDSLRGLAEDQQFISQAPVCLIFCADAEQAGQMFGERGRELFALQDATISAAYAQLAIVAAGMGSTWIGNFDAEGISRKLDIEAPLVPVALLSVGYPAELPEPTSRKRLDEMVTYR